VSDFIVSEVSACPELEALLTASGLPVGDVNEPGRRFFRVSASGGGLIGVIGAEAAGTAVLLRSLAVVPDLRGKGWGRRILAWALDRMADEGFAEAYALTVTIEPMLTRWGWSRIARDDAPAAIRESRQFAGLCPCSAALMRRPLPSRPTGGR